MEKFGLTCNRDTVPLIQKIAIFNAQKNASFGSRKLDTCFKYKHFSFFFINKNLSAMGLLSFWYKIIMGYIMRKIERE